MTDFEIEAQADQKPSVSRRSLFGAATALSIAAPAGAATKAKSSAQKHVLVLGAGMAGLTAALALRKQRHTVTVIEYQKRIGGRLWSLPLNGGQFTEAGGGHFRSNMPYTLSYLRRFRLPVVTMNDGLPRYLVDGKAENAANLAAWPWDLSPDERNVSVASSLNRYLFRAGLDTDTVLDARWPDPATLEALDNVTVADLLRNYGASNDFIKLLNAHGGTFTGASQALSVIADMAYHFGDQSLFRIMGGNARLPLAMAQEIGAENIVLGAPVVEIDDNGAFVKVTVADGRSFAGDAIISTIPFSVLTDISMKPGWSAGKAKMFREMEWDKTVKVAVQTKAPTWLAKNVHGWPLAGGDRPWERVIDITGNEAGGYGNVFFYMNGGNAEAIMAHPEADRANVVIQQFQNDLPGYISDVVAAKSIAWSEQPWIRGSFGSTPLRGGWMIKEWTKPEGRIHFAGDFTTLKTGWVEGAIESGLRAARQIDPAAEAEGRPSIRQEHML